MPNLCKQNDIRPTVTSLINNNHPASVLPIGTNPSGVPEKIRRPSSCAGSINQTIDGVGLLLIAMACRAIAAMTIAFYVDLCGLYIRIQTNFLQSNKCSILNVLCLVNNPVRSFSNFL